jgi:capsular polysaccharide biosynthesis protein
VLVLANAKLSSGLLLLIVYYGLGVIAALFTALTVIYLLAIYERVPLTVREIEAALGLPVLAQVPSANRDEV